MKMKGKNIMVNKNRGRTFSIVLLTKMGGFLIYIDNGGCDWGKYG